MNHRTQDVIVWDNLPHPDLGSRPSYCTVRVSRPFWQRLASHLRTSTSGRTAWERWLTPEAVEAIAAGEPMRLGRADATPLPQQAQIPSAAVERLYATLTASLARPFALCFGRPGTQKAFTPVFYHLVLVNGASLILRVMRDGLIELEDCFFTRAAREYASGVAVAASGAAESLATPFLPPAYPMPAPADATAALYMSIAPSSSPDEPSDVEGFAAFGAVGLHSSACHRAVLRQLVHRYAVLDTDAGGLVPPGMTPAHPAAQRNLQVRFLSPRLWGFGGPETNYRWTGCDTGCNGETSADNELADLDTLRRAFDAESSADALSSNHDAFVRLPKPAPGWGNVARMQFDEAGQQFDADREDGKPSDFAAGASVNRFTPTNRPASESPATADPLALLRQLSDALQRLDVRALGGSGDWVKSTCAEKTSRARAAAYAAAAALGQCRACGVEACGLTDGALSPDVALAAAHELERKIARWCEEAQSLPQQPCEIGQAAAEDACAGLLEARTEAWAAYLAIDESYAAATTFLSSSDDLAAALDRVLTSIDALDAALEGIDIDLHAAAGASRFCRTLHALLADPYSAAAPWWLEPLAPAGSLSLSL